MAFNGKLKHINIPIKTKSTKFCKFQSLLQELEKIPPDQVKRMERQVRNRIEKQKEMSRRALVKQNRLHNWMEHFKKHENLREQEYDNN